MKKIGLPLVIVGLFAVLSMGLVLFLIEEDIRISNEMYEAQLTRLNALVVPREGIRAAYQQYHSLIPDRIDIYEQSFEEGAVSAWAKGQTNSFIVRELRLSYFDGQVRFATLSEISPSGDWSQEANYYFRPDGTIAMVIGNLNTFYGDVTVRKERLYNANGEPIESKLEVLDIDTSQPVEREYYSVPLMEFSSVTEIQSELRLNPDRMS